MSLDTLRKVPELNLLSYVEGDEQEQQAFIDGLYTGLKEYGFIILTGHTVDSELCKTAYSKVHEFFNLDDEVKKKYVCPKGGGQRGYTAFGMEHAKDSDAMDLKEFYHVGREVPAGHEFDDFYPNNIWPTEVAGFDTTLDTLYNSLNYTAIILLEALGKALKLPENYFKEMIVEGNSILRQIHYPPVGNDVPEGSVRAAAHGDINLITILMGATDGGLELLDRDGTWLPVNTKEGQLVVDTGDMMQVLTNGLLPATIHRVVNPKDTSSTRYSMPFFVHPNPKAILDPTLFTDVEEELIYQPINAHEFLVKRLHEIGLM